MKSSPMILALLSAAALSWAGEPTPTPTSLSDAPGALTALTTGRGCLSGG
jgi:hypothetical protein